jgi:hypothetical protein
MGCGCKKRNEQPVQSTVKVNEVRTPAPTQPSPAQQ